MGVQLLLMMALSMFVKSISMHMMKREGNIGCVCLISLKG